ncbi:MAG: nucleotidyltransferase [Lachnospiraceae bacterium]
MKIAAVITEYNPFHNGHLYHLQESRRLTQADFLIVLMSGNFVQRGEPALIDKYTRTRMALQSGADLVIELPVPYATGSGEFFASGAISLLYQLNCVDFLCFGSESGNLNELNMIAQILSEEPEEFSALLNQFQKQGASFPVAREKALICYGNQYLHNDNFLSSIIKEPNNILAIEYLKALQRLPCAITPITIKRMGNHYHDTNLQSPFVSASGLRAAIYEKTDISDLAASMPSTVYALLTDYLSRYSFLQADDLSSILNYKKLIENDYELYWDMSEELSHRLKKIQQTPMTFSQTCSYLKTKQYTYSRISRCLLHLILDIKQTDITLWTQKEFTSYARILGFRKSASPLLYELKQKSTLPLITKTAAAKLNSAAAAHLFEKDLCAAHIYNQCIFSKSHTDIKHEWNHGMEIIP